MTETALGLLRNKSYCVYGNASATNVRGVEEAEQQFDEWSVDERGKLAEETLVNVDSRKQQVEGFRV